MITFAKGYVSRSEKSSDRPMHDAMLYDEFQLVNFNAFRYS